MNEILGIIIAAVIAWLNFVLIDTYLGLPEAPGVKGADIVGRDIKKEVGILLEDFSKGTFFVLQMHLQEHFLPQ